MLVITRKAGQKLQAGSNIEIEVVRTTSGRVTLAIKAPRDCRIVRAEQHLSR